MKPTQEEIESIFERYRLGADAVAIGKICSRVAELEAALRLALSVWDDEYRTRPSIMKASEEIAALMKKDRHDKHG